MSASSSLADTPTASERGEQATRFGSREKLQSVRTSDGVWMLGPPEPGRHRVASALWFAISGPSTTHGLSPRIFFALFLSPLMLLAGLRRVYTDRSSTGARPAVLATSRMRTHLLHGSGPGSVIHLATGPASAFLGAHIEPPPLDVDLRVLAHICREPAAHTVNEALRDGDGGGDSPDSE